jgi:hypothetical protein
MSLPRVLAVAAITTGLDIASAGAIALVVAAVGLAMTRFFYSTGSPRAGWLGSSGSRAWPCWCPS